MNQSKHETRISQTTRGVAIAALLSLTLPAPHAARAGELVTESELRELWAAQEALEVYVVDHYSAVSEGRLQWTGGGNDCAKAGYSDCKNLLLPGSRATDDSHSRWLLIPRADGTFYIQDFWDADYAHFGRLYWTSGGDDAGTAGYAPSQDLMLVSLSDTTSGIGGAAWTITSAGDDSFFITDAWPGAGNMHGRVYWTSGGDDCQEADYGAGCKNLILVPPGDSGWQRARWRFEKVGPGSSRHRISETCAESSGQLMAETGTVQYMLPTGRNTARVELFPFLPNHGSSTRAMLAATCLATGWEVRLATTTDLATTSRSCSRGGFVPPCHEWR